MPRTTKPKRRAVTPAMKVKLIREVSNKLYEETESFHHGNLGGDLAYLLAAIADDNHCQWYGDEESAS